MLHIISTLYSHFLQTLLKRIHTDRCGCLLQEIDLQWIYQLNLAPIIIIIVIIIIIIIIIGFLGMLFAMFI